MNISLYTQNPYSSYMQKAGQGSSGSGLGGVMPTVSVQKTAGGGALTQGVTKNSGQADSEKSTLSDQMKQMLRGLKKSSEKEQNPFAGTSQDKVNGFLDLSDSPDDDEDNEAEKPVNYNCKEVETKIQRAKTSVSAGQAVISAKRKVLEVKRKIASADGDSEELQLALTHARRMEMVARKKKHHLELEEMVQTTGERDERLEKQEEASDQIKNALVAAKEEEVTKREDAIFDERQKQISDAAEEVRDRGVQNSQDMLSELGKMLAEFGEEELKELEQAMEMLEDMEVVDPHMSKEDLEELKRKHRAA
ncbi:MAG: hypothetical protein K6E75_01435, partial [Lachnospiraceae bacterium]|nr:hypothetical protein [Lachnospiraceae bacterium]